MDQSADCREFYHKRAQQPKNQKNNDNRFKHEVPQKNSGENAQSQVRFITLGVPDAKRNRIVTVAVCATATDGDEHRSSLAERLGKLIGVFFRLFLRNPIVLLDRPSELIAFARDFGQFVIGELAPLLLDLANDLLPISRDLIPIHD